MNDGEQDLPLELIEWVNWFTRACIGVVLIVILAIILKFTLLAPVTELDYESKAKMIMWGGMSI